MRYKKQGAPRAPVQRKLFVRKHNDVRGGNGAWDASYARRLPVCVRLLHRMAFVIEKSKFFRLIDGIGYCLAHEALHSVAIAQLGSNGVIQID